MNILLTGGCGYVGTVLTKSLLEEGYTVTVVDTMWFGNYLPQGVRIIQKDLFSLREVLAYIKEAATKGMHIQRYKGLGEMNPQQLWDTTMDPDKRTILKVILEDAVEADKMFTVLMGDQVEPRREFIENYAHQVKNLDI